MAHPFFTIGHSTRSIPEFVDLLRASGVRMIVDVRKMPRSRTNPQFNSEALAESLGPFQIGYEHVAELGGLRGRRKHGDASLNLLWENRSFRNYADYATTEPFRIGLDRLLALGRTSVCAIMCAEAVWWRCHRRIIADYLLMKGETVCHILGPGQVGPARPTPGSVPAGDTILYPPGE